MGGCLTSRIHAAIGAHRPPPTRPAWGHALQERPDSPITPDPAPPTRDSRPLTTHLIATELAPDEAWCKSSYSDPGQSCPEAAHLSPSPSIAIRDSKTPTGPALLLPVMFLAVLQEGRWPPGPA
ncbi:DUF397 domain-containing protein [Streptomyces violaceus]|uniref:DUF397 domain-containing protein n=1 Tax=Streptomyces violaceus TaxID=1936 RepID=UPI002E292A79|nr:DUF397 domain-containing protein [Streptomyces violaceus]